MSRSSFSRWAVWSVRRAISASVKADWAKRRLRLSSSRSNLVTLKFQFGGIEFEAARSQFIQINICLGAAGNIGIGDAAAAIGEALLIEVLDASEGVNALADIRGKGFEMAQGFELGLQGFDIEQVFVEQVVMDEGTDIGERAEGQSLDDLGGEGIFELTEAVEQVDAVIFEAGEDVGAGCGQAGQNSRDGV